MINEVNVNSYCSQNIELIENYEEALNSLELYDCHHKREIDEDKSKQQLIEEGLYYNRPAEELIFLSHAEHTSLHFKGSQKSEETRKKMSEAMKGWCGNVGEKNGRYNKGYLTAGEKNGMFGKSAVKGKHWKLVDGKRVYYV